MQKKIVSDPKFEAFASSGASWIRSADALLDSAELLWKQRIGRAVTTMRKHAHPRIAALVLGLSHQRQMTVHRQFRYGTTFMLLAGLGIENLLKAIRVKQLHRKKELFVEDKNGRRQLTKAIAHHRSDDLADDTGFRATATERRLLKRLRHYVEWAGRYPVAKGDMKPIRAPDGKFEPTIQDDDLETVKALTKRLREFYGQA